MRGQQFSPPEDAVEASKNHVLDVSQSKFSNKTIFDYKYSSFHYYI